jgi:hypothetical protein
VVWVPDRRTKKELVAMGRPLAVLASLLLTGLGFVFLIPDCASACLCVGAEGSQKEIARDALSDSEAVFSGEVVDFENTPNITMMEGEMVTMMGGNTATATATLQVSEVWKGPERQTMQIGTAPNDGVSCGFPFEEGKEYLVYASGKQGLKTDGCSETKLLSKAGADLAVLGNSEKPKGGGNEALTDTSGGVSVGAMVGLAGLVVAASLLVVVRLVRPG